MIVAGDDVDQTRTLNGALTGLRKENAPSEEANSFL